MKRVAIITDSGADLPQSLVESTGIFVVPLYVTIGDNTRRDGVELTHNELYRLMEFDEASPHTSPPSPEDFRQIFIKALEGAQELICLTLSSGVSGAYRSAVLGREELVDKERVLVVDTLTVSMGVGLLVLTAVKLRDAGESVASIAGHLAATEAKALFTLENLTYLERAGRLSKASATIGKVLNVKPILGVSRQTEGIITGVTKARGRQKAFKYLLDETITALPGDYNGLLGISHAQCPDEAQSISLSLRNALPMAEVVIGEIGAGIGSHTGPGTVAVFFLV